MMKYKKNDAKTLDEIRNETIDCQWIIASGVDGGSKEAATIM